MKLFSVLCSLMWLIQTQFILAQPKTKDILVFDSLKINGKLPLITRESKVIQLLGKESKIVKVDQNTCVSYFFTETLFAENYVYYGKTKFESYGDTLVLTSIDFKSTPKVFLTHPKILINHELTMKVFLKQFPSAILSSQQDENEVLYKLSPSEVKENFDFWYFWFKNGKLIRLEYWMPC